MSSTQQLLLGEGAGGAAPAYIEDVFSTWLYDGNDSTQTITNGIDLSTKGGLVWTKCRNAALTGSHRLTDTVRGAGNSLVTSNTNGNEADSTILSAFTTTGFSLGSSPASSAPLSPARLGIQANFAPVFATSSATAVNAPGVWAARSPTKITLSLER